MLLLLACFCVSFSLHSQIKVESSGHVLVGNDTVPANNGGDQTIQLLGPNTNNYDAGSRLAFGDAYSNMWNVVVGEYTTNDTDQLWLHGKNGSYFTYGMFGNIVYAYFDPNISFAFAFDCDVEVNGAVLLASDMRLKQDINPISNSLFSLRKLNGVSYHLKRNQSSERSATHSNAVSPNLQMGFLAQELRTVFPDLVHENKDGLLSVDYIGLIPVIVESIKEQQAIIDAQSEKIKEMDAVVSRLTAEHPIPSGESTHAFLYQNAPNPFKDRTEIRYVLPEKVQSAEIYIFDMQGSLLKRIPAVQSGSVEVKGSDLRAGMYLYTLVVDGKQVDTKRMILTK